MQLINIQTEALLVQITLTVGQFLGYTPCYISEPDFSFSSAAVSASMQHPLYKIERRYV
jgi:hypothetical protein